MEMDLPDQSGRKLLRRLQRQFPDTAVIVITHVACLRTAVQAVQAGAMRYLLKPFDVADLVRCIQDVRAHQELACV
jgi:ActR/RegA family two-component response regulator